MSVEATTPHRERAASKVFARFVRCRRGANTVEFVLIAPVLLLLLLGILYVSVYLSIGHSLSQISADAARYAMVGLNETERGSLVERWVTDPNHQYGFVNRSRILVDTHEAAGALRVTVAYDMRYLPTLPILGSVISLPDDMKRSSTVPVL